MVAPRQGPRPHWRRITLTLCCLALPSPGRAMQEAPVPPPPRVDVASLFAPITLLPASGDSIVLRKALTPGGSLALSLAPGPPPETLEALLQGFAAAAVPDPWSLWKERPSREWRPIGFEPGDHGLLWHLGGALSTLVRRPGGG